MDYMEEKSLVISLFSAISVTTLAMYKFKKSKKEDGKPTEQNEFNQLTLLFFITFGIVFFISKMIIDSDDSKQMLNNIKAGDPPF